MILSGLQVIDINSIVQEGLIATHFQPIVSIRKKRVVGFEALSRGIGPDSSLIGPNILFGAAKAQSMTLQLDRLCRHKALKNFVNICSTTEDKLLFLNLSTGIICKGTVGSGNIIRTVRSLDLSPNSIVLEITESDTADIAELNKFIESYKAYGFIIALDDVGNGYSNLDRILQVKPNILKIDRNLITGIDKDYYRQELFKALIGLAKKIGAIVVAEGVETLAEGSACLEFGADWLQGYYFAQPSPDAICASKNAKFGIGEVASRYAELSIRRIQAEQTRRKECRHIANWLVRELEGSRSDNFQEILTKLVLSHSGLEYLYILNLEGQQITDTIGSGVFGVDSSSNVFKPARLGADQSLREYYLQIRAGRELYISEPYISLATGHSCITCSVLFRDKEQCEYIFCADFNHGGFSCI